MANVRVNEDSLTVTLDVDEFIRGNIQPRAEARMGGSVVAYFVMDKLRATMFAGEMSKYSAVTTTFLKGKLVVTFKDIDTS
jgi:hypothetical protein